MKKNAQRYTVIDNHTGRRGRLEQGGGYAVGAHYVNPSWHIVWDEEDSGEVAESG